MDELMKMFKEKLGDVFTSELEEKLKVNFDVLVNEKVSALIVEKEIELKESFDKKETELDEKNASDLATFKEETIENIDKFIGYASDKFFEDNKIAIVSEMKLEAAEKIVEQSKEIFESAKILTMSEEDFDATTELQTQVSELKEKLNDSIKSEIELREQIENGKMQKSFFEKTADLTQIQVSDVETMMEGLQFDGKADFDKKLDIVIEKVSSKKSKQIDEKTEKTGINKYLV